MLQRNNLPALLWNVSIITHFERQFSFQPFPLSHWESWSPLVRPFLVFSIIPSVVVFESVTCFLLQGVCKPLHCSYGETFPLSPLHTKRRVGTLHIGHDPDSSLQVAVNPMAIYLTSCIEKPVHFDLLQTFRKSMPCVAVWRGWREEENFLFVRGSVIFCGGSTVRWSYWSPSIQSVVHV